jgi:NADH-quinone oxidoreductase subunit N
MAGRNPDIINRIIFKLLFCLAAFLSIALTIHPYQEKEQQQARGAYYIIFIGMVAGTFLLVMARNLLMVYLSLELISLCSYLLTSFRFDKNSAEAGLKYLLYGAVASGIMLYGMSLLYGFTGTLELGEVFAQRLALIHWLPLSVAILMTSCGFLFKISAVPFHIWAPDVYQGAPLPTVAYFSVAPKLAGLLVLARFSGTFNNLEILNFDWRLILSVIAILTIIVGNFSALWQQNARRMMAYSSIAHGGFLLIGLIVLTPFGLQSFLFYAAVYLLMNFGAFFLLNIIGNITGSLIIDDFKGLGREHPYMGIMFIVVMIGLTGLPPTAGFTAKLLIFSSLWEVFQQTEANYLLYLLVFGILNTIISLFFYLKIPYFMFFKESNIVASYKIFQFSDKIFATILIILILILFFRSNWLLDLINSITFVF